MNTEGLNMEVVKIMVLLRGSLNTKSCIIGALT